MARNPRAVLGVACGTHFVHDGFADILLVLPLWASEFRLSLTQVGLLKMAYSGGMAAFQIPAGILAERWGERRLLAAGTATVALGYLAVGTAGGFTALLGYLLLAGLASGVQHPLSSSLVARAYESGSRRMALGTYNFSGDLGKVAWPVGVALLLPIVGWRGAVTVAALVGLAGAGAVLAGLWSARAGAAPELTPTVGGNAPERTSGWGIRDPRAYTALSAIHVIDNSTRSSFLTFLPFLLIAKGSAPEAVGFALMLAFAGGAAGKFVCGALADRVGVIRTVVLTEAATGLGIVLLLTLPLTACLPVLPLVGMALNGTSSVLYGSVADVVASDRRARSYALFYTVGVGASALSPVLYGLVGDHAGVPMTLLVIGCLVFLTIPLALPLRQALAAAPAAAR
jgi:MFS family permease